jgi:hypothetical protein
LKIAIGASVMPGRIVHRYMASSSSSIAEAKGSGITRWKESTETVLKLPLEDRGILFCLFLRLIFRERNKNLASDIQSLEIRVKRLVERKSGR